MCSNIYKGIHLTFEEQINLFEERGMNFKDGKDKAKEKLHIYDLKRRQIGRASCRERV